MKLSRFEKARVIGARALQIALGAPILVDVDEDLYDPIAIALQELDEEAIPLEVVRKLPERWTN